MNLKKGGWIAKALPILLLLAASTAGWALPPAQEYDRLNAKAGTAINEERWADALEAMQGMIATQMPLSADFRFFYAKVLFLNRQYLASFRSATAYLAEQGRTSKYYRQALALRD